ncbi:MAG: alpha/beta fold hydrolase [Gemmatimonadota bacterium]
MNWFFHASRGSELSARRLFCIPFAGGSAVAYRDWGDAMGEGVEVLGIQLPGRGWRLKESPVPDLATLADLVAEAIAPRADRPFAVFGHSMGAWLAYEAVRRLEARGLRPDVLFVSGRQAPSIGAKQSPLGELDDERFVAEIQRRYAAIPQPILDHPDALQLLLPALRADILALERHVAPAGAGVTCPIQGILGKTDPVVDPVDMEPWSAETTGRFTLHLVDGGHFYLADDVAEVARLVRSVWDATEAARPAIGAASS